MLHIFTVKTPYSPYPSILGLNALIPEEGKLKTRLVIRFFNRRAKAPSFEDVVSSIWMSRQGNSLPRLRTLFSFSGLGSVSMLYRLLLGVSAWNVVEEDLYDAVLHFFESCYLPFRDNATASLSLLNIVGLSV
ncbi:uncharacterized protein E5676_scaffold675G00520 [Cucumis melo var. makuwa]|uniref:Uncharacterized protein n=1 Tax=Cucumis melo var. makuwa TaxID=1194695 RepID=A0A5A7UBS9_CUCMM|nr:uncharacterized protein E6C27_scaffold2606G00020 [Cucumis melo var. makuwa]TYK04376.1 uncharacterized protein E5676_scaffold675G00520 [Cucumis melo var. makuwa]